MIGHNLLAELWHATKGPMWGYPVFVLGAISSFLEPFRGHLSPKIDKVPEELTLRYHHEEPWVVVRDATPGPELRASFAHADSNGPREREIERERKQVTSPWHSTPPPIQWAI